jgi:hypothetical protein
MIRHQITVSGVLNISDIKSIIRTSTPGTFTISTSSTAKQGYNDPTLYITERSIAIIPNSTTSNTLITNDGIIVVYRNTNLIEVVDLFESGLIAYDSIIPIDYTILTEYALNINPQHKRIFLISGKDVNNNLLTNNLKIYNDSTTTYFRSDMDLDLETDDYGYYGIANASFVEQTSTFSLIKKQFYLIKAPAGTELYIDDVKKDPILEDEIVGNFYWFTDLNIGTSKYLTFNLRNSSVLSGTIIIY